MTATGGFLTALERTKFVFNRDSAPDPAGGAHSAPRPHNCLRGPTSKGRWDRGEEREGKGEKKGKAGDPLANSWIRPW